MNKYKFLDHTADIKFQVKANSLNEIFEGAALALSEILSRGTKIKSKSKKTIQFEEKDKEALLYRFLDELIYLLDAENFILSSAKVSIIRKKLRATVSGDKATNYPDLDHVKAATYAEMYVKKTKTGWEAQAVLDV